MKYVIYYHWFMRFSLIYVTTLAMSANISTFNNSLDKRQPCICSWQSLHTGDLASNYGWAKSVGTCSFTTSSLLSSFL